MLLFEKFKSEIGDKKTVKRQKHNFLFQKKKWRKKHRKSTTKNWFEKNVIYQINYFSLIFPKNEGNFFEINFGEEKCYVKHKNWEFSFEKKSSEIFLWIISFEFFFEIIFEITEIRVSSNFVK